MLSLYIKNLSNRGSCWNPRAAAFLFCLLATELSHDQSAFAQSEIDLSAIAISETQPQNRETPTFIINGDVYVLSNAAEGEVLRGTDLHQAASSSGSVIGLSHPNYMCQKAVSANEMWCTINHWNPLAVLSPVASIHSESHAYKASPSAAKTAAEQEVKLDENLIIDTKTLEAGQKYKMVVTAAIEACGIRILKPERLAEDNPNVAFAYASFSFAGEQQQRIQLRVSEAELFESRNGRSGEHCIPVEKAFEFHLPKYQRGDFLDFSIASQAVTKVEVSNGPNNPNWNHESYIDVTLTVIIKRLQLVPVGDA